MTPNPALLEFMQTRRSYPALQLSEPGPSKDEIEAILKIASRVPDHGKLAPWRFIVFTGEERVKMGEAFVELAAKANGDMSEASREAELSRFTRAPVVIAVVSMAAVHPKIPVWEQELSAGACCMNLLIAANAHGYGASWLTEWMAFDRTALSIVGLAETEKLAGFIHLGTPIQPPNERPRPEVASLIEWR